jgi:sulfhydrogenase subunit beta (sulfur reductase)
VNRIVSEVIGNQPPQPGDAVVIRVGGLDELIGRLRADGFSPWGPVVRDGAIIPGPIVGVGDLARGVHDVQSPGSYRLEHTGDERLFAWAVGPGSWKAAFFVPREEVWCAKPVGRSFVLADPDRPAPKLALVGVRPCDSAALSVLDTVFVGGPFRDSVYAMRRAGTFVVTVECGWPSATCFCLSMGTGPGSATGFDIALTELGGTEGHRFLARAGTERGAMTLALVNHERATAQDFDARLDLLSEAASNMARSMETAGLAGLLADNLDHPRWAEVAERCLSCANCTLVCPTCFCSDVRDTTDLDGAVQRHRSWSSCFDLDHSFLHGGAVRLSTSSRYRQWMTHKLSTWWDQFDASGCVGCGRCITWCPAGIDITEEARALSTIGVADHGATGPGGEHP